MQVRFGEAALDAMQHGDCGRLLNYAQLPDVAWNALLAHFGFALNPPKTLARG